MGFALSGRDTATSLEPSPSNFDTLLNDVNDSWLVVAPKPWAVAPPGR